MADNNNPREPSAAESLERNSPNTWPEPWNRAGELPTEVRPDVDATILAALREAREKSTPSKVAGFKRPSHAWFALAALLPIAAGIYIYIASQSPAPSGITVAASAGTSLPSGNVVSGGKLRLKSGAAARLETARGGKAILVSGPAEMRIQKRGDTVELYVRRGRFTLISRPRGHREKIVFVFADIRLRPIGTAARLRVEKGFAKLTVVEGVFEAVYPDGRRPIRIQAGRTWSFAAGRITMGKAEPANGDGVKAAQSAWRKGVTIITPPAARVKRPIRRKPRAPVVTLATIRKKYGSLHIVRLHNGEIVHGHVRVIARETITVITPAGRRIIPRADLASMKVE